MRCGPRSELQGVGGTAPIEALVIGVQQGTGGQQEEDEM